MRSEDWPSATLRSIAVERGLIGGPFGSSLGTKDYLDDGVPVIRGGNLARPPFVSSDLVFVSDEKADSLSRCLAEPGDIVATQRGTLGQIGRIPQGSYPRWLISQSQMALRVDPTLAEADFVYQCLLSPRVQQQIRERAIVTGVPHINLGIFGELEIPYPPLVEQRRIAGVLGALDDKIDSNRRLAGLLEETAAALFKARFVDFVGVEEFQDSEIGPIPAGWAVSPTGNVLTVVGGSTPSTKEPAYWDGPHCWVTPKDLAGASSPVLLGSSRHISDAGVARISSRLLPIRTVLLSSRAPVGYTAVSFVPVAVNQGFIAIPPNDHVPSEFVFFWLKENLDLIKQHAGGTTFAEISKSAFRPLPMLTPNESDLREFAGVAAPSFDHMAQLERETVTLTAVRDALLPKLISGAIRVPDTSDVGEVIEPLAEAVS